MAKTKRAGTATKTATKAKPSKAPADKAAGKPAGKGGKAAGSKTPAKGKGTKSKASKSASANGHGATNGATLGAPVVTSAGLALGTPATSGSVATAPAPAPTPTPAPATATRSTAPVAPVDLDAKGIRGAAETFKLLADPTRLSILSALTDGELNVGQLTGAVRMTQPATSHHLALLRASKLVESRREGKHNYYSLTDRGRTGVRAMGALA